MNNTTNIEVEEKSPLSSKNLARFWGIIYYLQEIAIRGPSDQVNYK